MCCCMSTYTIMIGDQCVVVCQPTPSWLWINVLLYVNLHHHDRGSMCCCMSTGAVQVPLRGYFRGLHQSWHQTGLGRPGQRVSYRHWRQQTQQENRRRIQGIGRTLYCLFTRRSQICAPRHQTSSLHTERSDFFPLQKQNNIEINRSLVWRFGAASVIPCWKLAALYMVHFQILRLLHNYTAVTFL